jgi:hypothetical protein
VYGVAVTLVQVGKLGRDIKNWKVWEAMRDRVEQFRQTMPVSKGAAVGWGIEH